ncbi:MAG: hypothetical protein H7145_20105 [Akkermansiaceae bacterium]|nr:hypothetical protein [Armatimonadota bacterium]
MSDGRSRYLCPACRKHFLSEYKGARPERDTARRVRHPFSLCLNRRARLGLSAYVQATRSTDPQAVRAIFRHVLTGQVFSTGSVGRGGRSGAIRICREPASASVRFPDLRSESAKKSRVAAGGGHAGQRFQPTVLVVRQIRVFLDDEAKEGLIHAMRWLSMNHADAARWLLANVKMPGVDIPGYLGLAPTPWVAGSGGKKRRYEWEKGYDPDWDD